jgi:hypothetical protein
VKTKLNRIRSFKIRPPVHSNSGKYLCIDEEPVVITEIVNLLKEMLFATAGITILNTGKKSATLIMLFLTIVKPFSKGETLFITSGIQFSNVEKGFSTNGISSYTSLIYFLTGGIPRSTLGILFSIDEITFSRNVIAKSLFLEKS